MDKPVIVTISPGLTSFAAIPLRSGTVPVPPSDPMLLVSVAAHDGEMDMQMRIDQLEGGYRTSEGDLLVEQEIGAS